MKKLTVSTDFVKPFLSEDEIQKFQQELYLIWTNLQDKKGKGSEFLGWHQLPSQLNPDFLEDIRQTAFSLQQKSEYFVVIGIGGSYLGARAVVEALSDSFAAYKKGKFPKIIFAGQNLSEDYLAELLELLDNHDYSMTVISKSGTTTEPAVAFRLLKNHLENKYGKQEAASRIVAITDKEKGALKKLADQEGYKTYEVPDDVGGRFSVLTAVGLLPIAVAGFDIIQLVEGAKVMQSISSVSSSLKINPAALYAASRNALYQKGYKLELLVNYRPQLMYFAEWWKQLYGESEGKEGKGIFPASVSFTTDLHSMGQYVQDGPRFLFETILSVENKKHNVQIPVDETDMDGLNFLAGKNIEYVNQKAEQGTILAHLDGGVPVIKIEIEKIDEFNIGQLIYFFEVACAYSAYLLNVNPFDQPGVEAYKKNMFALLKKPGFEKESEEIYKKIQ